MTRLFWLVSLFLLVAVSHAQTLPDAWEVYVLHDIDATGTDELQFINLRTGDLTTAQVNGERYTPIGDTVVYFDRAVNNVQIVEPDGTVSAHPFIGLGSARRIDWIVSEDQRLIAWTLTYEDVNGLTTVTSVANPSGANQDVLLSDVPRTDGTRILPVAFSVDNSAIMLDIQPDGIGELAPYRQYAGLLSLSLVDGTLNLLPNEPLCFCAGALRAGYFLRLAVTSDFSGFDVHFHDLATEEFRIIQSTGLVNYTQGGNILISPDGSLAVYSLSQIEITSTEPTVRTVMMLVDLQTFTQEQLSDPITSYIQPIHWTEDNTAILFTIPDDDGTWKLDITTRELTRIASATYIGLLER